VKELAQTVAASYLNGVPVILFARDGGILHGIETLETITATQVSVTCLTIKGIDRQAFESTDLPEFCEAARQVWLGKTTN
jgi:hypothetical protein